MDQDQLLKSLMEFSVALSQESDLDNLVERIFNTVTELANADGASLYLRNNNDQLEFYRLKNAALRINQGPGESPLPPVDIFSSDGDTKRTVSAHVAATGEISNIPDVYQNTEFTFDGTKSFDANMGYHSQSLLTLPMKNNEGNVIAVLQLINAKTEGGRLGAFSDDIIPGLMAIASNAAVALDKQRILKHNEELIRASIGQQTEHRVFISHSSKDRATINERILPILEQENIGYWYSESAIQTAAEWERSILAGLEACNWFLIVLSPAALESEWVKDELFWAIDNRPDHIIPVIIEPCDPSGLHIRMRRLQVLSLTGGEDPRAIVDLVRGYL